jgi:hypothetical protein
MNMSYRRQISYNTHDCKVSTGSRHCVTLGVIHRATVSLNAIIRHGAKGISLGDLVVQLNARLNANYLVADIRYAVNKKLVKDGLVEVIGRSRYRASPDAKQAWKDMPKQFI